MSRLKLLTHLQLISIKNKIETLQSGTLLLRDDDGDGKKKNDIRKKGEEKPQEAEVKVMAGGALRKNGNTAKYSKL